MFDTESWNTDNAQDCLSENLFGTVSSRVVDKVSKVVTKDEEKYDKKKKMKSRKKVNQEIIKANVPLENIKANVPLENIKGDVPLEQSVIKGDRNMEASSKNKKKQEKKRIKHDNNDKNNRVSEDEPNHKKAKMKSERLKEETRKIHCEHATDAKTSEVRRKVQKKTKITKITLEAKDEKDFPKISDIDNIQSKQTCESQAIEQADVIKHDNGVSRSKYSKFQSKLSRRLEGGHFRWINEKLYTAHSEEAVKMFTHNPELFEIYHKGFTWQVNNWPENPVNVLIDYVKKRNDSSLIVADFGCGDAKLAQGVTNKVHSFDLVAQNKFVTACDMKKVPLQSNSVDIAVFCLSLMGTNFVDFLLEAKRVLKTRGTLLIAEVKSRFDDVDEFIQNVSQLGFELVKQNNSNKMFVLMEYVNSASDCKSDIDLKLKPCIYKRR